MTNLDRATGPTDGIPGSSRILLVEDQPDNQVLTTKMIQKLGGQVQVANNGQEALEILASQDFDLILMDIQMPVMDGLTATRRIREQGNQVPILALTAHARAEDRKNCLSAGCNEFITKPVRMVTLKQAIDQWTGPGGASATVPTDRPQAHLPAPGGDDPIRSTLVEEDEGFLPLVQEYVTNLPSRLNELTTLVEGEDFPEIAQAAHRIKGTGGGYGYQVVTDIGTDLERAAIAEDGEGCRQALHRFTDAVARIRKGMETCGTPA